MSLLLQTAIFGVICLASYQIGQFFRRVKLPTITGYLFAGALAGPFVLEMLPESSTSDLRFVDEISLAVIALVAGSELLISQLRPRFRAIGATVGSILVLGYLVLALAIYFLAPFIPFTADFVTGPRLALALLGAAVLLALSPPSTIAVIKEVEARGRFTRTVLGVTVLMDVAIIVLFAAMTSVASPLLEGGSLDLSFLGLLAIDLFSALAIGLLMGLSIMALLATRAHVALKTLVIFALGFGVYELADLIRRSSVDRFGFEIYIEPLLISLIAGLFVVNYTRHREQFDKLLHDVSPFVYVAFFTITGISLKLDLLASVLPFAIALFAVRAIGIALGANLGGRLAGESRRDRRVSWMAYITQAGIALGLAREVAVQFPGLGDAFATLIISVVVINEIAGPLFLKSALRRVGESHEKGERHADDGRVMVFGIESQTLELAAALRSEGRPVTLISVGPDPKPIGELDADWSHIEELDDASLSQTLTEDVSAVVTVLPDDTDNERVLRYSAQEADIERLVVRPSAASENGRYETYGALVVHPTTAIVSLLMQSVLSPDATSLLLHHDRGREMLQIEVTNQDLDGLSVRDVSLPSGVLLMEVRRDNTVLLVDGQTRLRTGDQITLIADIEAEAEARLLLSN